MLDTIFMIIGVLTVALIVLVLVGIKLGWITGKVTYTDPKTGKVTTLADNEKEKD